MSPNRFKINQSQGSTSLTLKFTTTLVSTSYTIIPLAVFELTSIRSSLAWSVGTLLCKSGYCFNTVYSAHLSMFRLKPSLYFVIWVELLCIVWSVPNFSYPFMLIIVSHPLFTYSNKYYLISTAFILSNEPSLLVCMMTAYIHTLVLVSQIPDACIIEKKFLLASIKLTPLFTPHKYPTIYSSHASNLNIFFWSKRPSTR